jgi:ComF family protein
MIKVFFILLDFIFPCRCVSCGEPVSGKMNHLCSECRGLMKPLDNGCSVCSGVIHDGRCTICGDRKFYPDRHLSLFSYEKVSRAAVHSLKFEGMKHVYKVFLPYICSSIDSFNEQIDIVTFVPMNRKKMVKRGYNQSKLLAGGVGIKTGIEFKELLRELSNSSPQRSLNYNERFINVIDRYETVNNTKLKDKVILLIDDVFTTGATINECSRQLILSGAAKVFSITVVRSDLKKLENV